MNKTEEDHVQEFLLLVARVEKINLGASQFLRGRLAKWKRLKGCQGSFVPAGQLSECFDWSSTPQGSEFWIKLNSLVEGKNLI